MRGQILWRALRWRFGSAAMLFIVATLAIAGAAIGPMFLQSADGSVLSGVLAAAPQGADNLAFSSQGLGGTESRIAAASRAAVTIGGRGLLRNPILTTDLGISLIANKGPKSKKGQPYIADLVDRTGICRHVQFIVGHCPTGEVEVALSERTASLIHRRIGETIPVMAHNSSGLKLEVVGIYLQPPSVDTTYWAGGDYFPYGTGSSSAARPTSTHSS